MSEALPVKIKSSKMLAVLFIYAKQLQLLKEEYDRVKGDQNIQTCRDEYIESIWGQKLGQIFTSDFDIAEYRQILLDLVKVSLQDSTKQNIKDVVNTYFPDATIEIYEYWKDMVIDSGIATVGTNATKIECATKSWSGGDSGNATVGTDATKIIDSTKTWDTNQWVNYTVSIAGKGTGTITANNATTLTVAITVATNGDAYIINGQWVGYIAYIPNKGYAEITANDSNTLTVAIVGATSGDSFEIRISDNVHMLGYNWQNTSLFFAGVGYNPTTNPERDWVGNVWNGVKTWIPDLTTLGYFLFGVQLHLRNLNAGDVAKIEQYVIPAIETFVRPAGIYYKTIVLDIDLFAADREKSPSTRELVAVDSILGFGVSKFGSAIPPDADDWGFGAPSLP